jgi:hypothetical protein
VAEPMSKEELDKLAHGIAYDASTTAIECNCLMVPEEQAGQRDWFDVGDPDALAKPFVEECVRYLEMRGLIVRHPSNSMWVQLQDESEATN